MIRHVLQLTRYGCQTAPTWALAGHRGLKPRKLDSAKTRSYLALDSEIRSRQIRRSEYQHSQHSIQRGPISVRLATRPATRQVPCATPGDCCLGTSDSEVPVARTQLEIRPYPPTPQWGLTSGSIISVEAAAPLENVATREYRSTNSRTCSRPPWLGNTLSLDNRGSSPTLPVRHERHAQRGPRCRLNHHRRRQRPQSI